MMTVSMTVGCSVPKGKAYPPLRKIIPQLRKAAQLAWRVGVGGGMGPRPMACRCPIVRLNKGGRIVRATLVVALKPWFP